MEQNNNVHITDYLTYYCGLNHSPKYAVLLNGKWGIGKTYIMKKFLNALDINGQKHLYVSLNGLANIDDINSLIFQALYPVLQWRGAKLVGQAGRAALKYFRIDPDLTAADLVDIPKDCIYVFDDLERSAIDVLKVMGYINNIVEHDGAKVIIIANEEEIEKSLTNI